LNIRVYVCVYYMILQIIIVHLRTYFKKVKLENIWLYFLSAVNYFLLNLFPVQSLIA